MASAIAPQLDRSYGACLLGLVSVPAAVRAPPPRAPQGTAFYALQSCANHSCAPNAAADGDVSGAALLIAETDIEPGAVLLRELP
jgi:hypothetical protein